MEVEEYTRNGLTVKIQVDEDPLNPRDNDNIGVMIYSHPKYELGDEMFDHDDYEGWDDFEKYLREERGAVVVLPLNLHDHSGLSMSIGTSRGWDNGQVGFIYITKQDMDDYVGMTIGYAEEILTNEVKEFDQYLRGDIYGYSVVNPKDDELIASCWNLYGLEYAKEEANVEADEYVWPKDAAYAKSARELHK